MLTLVFLGLRFDVLVLNRVVYILCFLVICSLSYAQVQGDTTSVLVIDTSLSLPVADTTAVRMSSNPFLIDTMPGTAVTVQLSSSAIEEPIDYYSKDTSWFEASRERIHLYGEAMIKYGQQELKAGYIVFDLAADEATAYETTAAPGRPAERVIFSDGSQDLVSKELRFNFETKKGIIRDAVTQQGEFNVLGSRTKYVSKDANPLIDYDEIFNTNSLITTCTADHPHFGIRARKLKVVPDKLAIAGFSNLEIMGIPTPLFLPFGMFPLIQGQSSGLIFPNLWTYEERFGLGLQGVGYYFNINDYMDLKLTADLFTRGTHRINAQTNYKKRYKYTGFVQIQYANQITDFGTTAESQSFKSFKINIRHTQDAKAHPYRNLGGQINFQTNGHDRANRNDFEAQTQNIFGSSFNLRHQMPSTPFNFTLGLEHRQETQKNTIDVTFPKMSLNMNSIYPFKRKGGSGPERWYENVNLRYNGSAEARVTGSDSTFFSQETLSNVRSGVSHGVDIQSSTRVLKYFNLTPSISYDEVWYFRTLEKSYDPTLLLDTIQIDTTLEGELFARVDTTFGTLVDNYVSGFDAFRDFTARVSLNTQLFATKRFSRGWLRGLRHTMKPDIGFNYSPGTRDVYEEVVQARDANGDFIDERYNPFTGGIYNGRLDERQMAMTYRITNIFEAKYHSKRDSTDKKVQLLRNLSIGGDYNWARDSLRLSRVSISGNTQLLKNITNLTLNAAFDPYVYEDGRFINRTVWSETGRPLSFNFFSANFNTNMSIGQIRDLIVGTGSQAPAQPASAPKGRKAGRTEALIDLFESFRLSHNYNIRYERLLDTGRDTFKVSTHTLRLSGNLQLTENWNISIGNITYDIKNKGFVYPFLTFNRNLHCWDMSFTWAPEQGAYTFFIGVKSTTLSFLKYNYGQNNFGGDLR